MISCLQVFEKKKEKGLKQFSSNSKATFISNFWACETLIESFGVCLLQRLSQSLVGSTEQATSARAGDKGEEQEEDDGNERRVRAGSRRPGCLLGHLRYHMLWVTQLQQAPYSLAVSRMQAAKTLHNVSLT